MPQKLMPQTTLNADPVLPLYSHMSLFLLNGVIIKRADVGAKTGTTGKVADYSRDRNRISTP